MGRVSRRFYSRPCDVVARALLGKRLVHGTRSGIIVETEAYGGPLDKASHARFGRTKRNAVMFGPPGHLYVYRSYGIHWCVNLVCQGLQAGAAVLLRAVEPLVGQAIMRRRRGNRPDRELAAGPGRLTQALGITRSLDGRHMPEARVVVVQGGSTVSSVLDCVSILAVACCSIFIFGTDLYWLGIGLAAQFRPALAVEL